MNYAAHYERLVERARCRDLSGYRERHHVVPKCMGGGNEKLNIVELTGEEHYVAHQLLVRIFPEVNGLAIAAVRMARQCSGSRAYAWLRKRVAVETRLRETGKTRSPEHCAKMSAARAKQKRRPCSPETRAKIGAANAGKKQSQEVIAKRANSNRGKSPSVETRAKISAANLGSRRSLEDREKMSKSHSGKPRLNRRGIPLSAEHKAKLAAANVGKRLSEEHKQNIGVASRAVHAMRRAALLGASP